MNNVVAFSYRFFTLAVVVLLGALSKYHYDEKDYGSALMFFIECIVIVVLREFIFNG